MTSAVTVAVIFGGRSAEHDVSCKSAASVLRFLDRTRYTVVPIRITIDGIWLVGTDRPGQQVDVDALHTMTPEDPHQTATPIESMFAALTALREVDVVLPCLHGPYGEDGTLQSVLEFAGIPYVGSGVLASATSMDKEFTKKILAAEGIAVADGVVLRHVGDIVTETDRVRLGLPVFVKPARGGSSIGVSVVRDWVELDAAVAEARRTDTKVLVEAAVPGREVDVGVLEQPGGVIEAGPTLEIGVGSQRAFFDYEAKYREGQGTTFTIPADLDAATTEALELTALRVFRALGCAGLLRVDFFLPVIDGRMVPTVNEVNTMPGLTAMSQFPRMWQAAGTSYPDLLDLLLRTALHVPADLARS
ncbi:D-alanine-D-alanine ligase [Actinoplanes lutulentus]|uniref:D-alanine--D-alanine ligase n=1 Tax=Actinoplanes lutulentus TaxID=1287878 RepID=A0A327ZLM4_9ACTN|nr:D-alanine--D-alanine ligase family protein [Actinoplanes lutulentus]MBB2940615.1 D-alanine-D-alanine ligase [Actinoplanes lutulentus]RAK42926.1 D-alanine--D-alanine ligase [Actinoplanes lutulentus]